MVWKPIVSILLILFVNTIALSAEEIDDDDFEQQINNIISVLRRAAPLRRRPDHILDVPREPEDLPQAEPIHPGYTLIRPSLGMLKSALRFTKPDKGRAVYGNLDNLSITYGKTSNRVEYTSFRRSNNRLLDSTLNQAIRNIQKSNGDDESGQVYLIEIDLASKSNSEESFLHKKVPEEENHGGEILDDYNENQRRSDTIVNRAKDTLFIDQTSSETSSGTSSDTSKADSDYEKNPGNPYTVKKEKYMQNFLWNHFMDGDHMNINPLGPKYKLPGANAVDLFFGRKWWYFNQDDYKPLG